MSCSRAHGPKSTATSRRTTTAPATYMAQTPARNRGWNFDWRLIEVPGVGHDVEAMYASPDAYLALFETSY